MRRGAGLAAALLLGLGCAGGGPPAQGGAGAVAPEAHGSTAPAAAEAGAAGESEAQRRFEEFARRSRERGAAAGQGDAEARVTREMERRRQAALAAGKAKRAHVDEMERSFLQEDVLDAVELRIQQRDRESQGKGAPRIGCVREELPVEPGGDRVPPGPLDRSDFAAKRPPGQRPLVPVPGGELDAWLQLELLCVMDLRLSELPDGRWEVRVHHLAYHAFALRSGSWWSRRADARADAVLAHQRLHLDIAALFARALGARADAARHATASVGKDPEAASAAFQEAWASYLVRARDELAGLIARYDRETRYGTDAARQAEWARRVAHGLPGLLASASAG